jgi:nicotinate-nucleotide adenylyltransferase
MSTTGRLGLLGGTFDPVHYGHLDVAEAARTRLELDQVMFIPSHDPPHRPVAPRVSAYHRFALIALAIDGRNDYGASDVELARDGPSFTVDTLRGLHAEGWRPWQLFFIIGADAFAEIATWHEFPAVLDAANFAVMTRPGTSLEAALQRTPYLQPRARRYVPHATESDTTSILLVDASTRDVSSTQIRARIAAEEPIDDLVPRSVARHIESNHLYRAVGELHG